MEELKNLTNTELIWKVVDITVENNNLKQELAERDALDEEIVEHLSKVEAMLVKTDTVLAGLGK